MPKFWLALVLTLPADALTIQLDYRYDQNDFFSASGNPQGASGAAKAREALSAAAARWSAIIDQGLLPVNVGDEPVLDIRLGFNHPATGQFYQVSSAAGANTDVIVNDVENPERPADEYRNGISIPANTWILYAGGRPLGQTAAEGGTAVGRNLPETFNDPGSFMNRGFNSGAESLPVWGGVITFNSSKNNWNFDHTAVAGLTQTDFYSIALHEIGHALGISLRGFTDWNRNTSRVQFTGANAVAAYNADNNTSLNSLALAASNNHHWADGIYFSKIFPLGNPNYLGTVGEGGLQDLLMESAINFVSPGKLRFEITNVEVGALQDLGWSVTSLLKLPGSGVKVSRAPSGQMTLTFPSASGESYLIETSRDLTRWFEVTPAISSEGSSTNWTDGESGFNDPLPQASMLEAKYYRVTKQW